MPGDSRFKHDADVRRHAVALFDAHWGYHPVASKLGIPADTVRQWLYKYRAVGLEGLLLMGSRQSRYTLEQKVGAARAVVDGGMSVADAMATFKVASRSPLQSWCRAYREGGAEALKPKPKGRPKGSANRPRPPKTREQELEERLRKLEAENAYLKKLEALRAEEVLRTGSRPRW